MAATFGGIVGVALVTSLPKKPVDVGDEAPKEEVPNFAAPVEALLLWGVIAEVATVGDPKAVTGVVEAAPGFWKNGEEEGVVFPPPNAPKPG